MEPAKFATQIKTLVVDEATEEYKDLLVNTDNESVRDGYWLKTLALYRSLTPEQQDSFIQVINQVSLDVVSHIFGILDGSSYFDGSDTKFTLTDSDGDQLNGDLQSMLLEDES